ncbi:MAG: hypothetical protein K2X77_14875 [Candidatus Obscuribacterales bacterium]|nr:hypothetical protein [Candidatus Obscuribacterales bacterium]
MLDTDVCTAGGANDFVRQMQIAVRAGCAARNRAATVGHKAIYELESNGDQDMVLIRAYSVICQVPLLIARAVAASRSDQEDPIKLSVMELNLQEYPGTLPRMLDGGKPDVSFLGMAGAWVYDFLHSRGLQPELEYVYNGDTRTYSLNIMIWVYSTWALSEEDE